MGLLDGIRERRGQRQVVMMVSVGVSDDEQYLGGLSYWMPTEMADQWILKGYAKGTLSREYTPEEVSEMRRLDTRVAL